MLFLVFVDILYKHKIKIKILLNLPNIFYFVWCTKPKEINLGCKPITVLYKRSTNVNSIITQFSWLHLSLMCLTYCCLETKSLKTNFMYIFSSETGKSWMIMQKVSQMGSEADDTAIIWSLGCSIDSLSTRSASLPLMESHDFSSWRNVQTHTSARTQRLAYAHTTFASV